MTRVLAIVFSAALAIGKLAPAQESTSNAAVPDAAVSDAAPIPLEPGALPKATPASKTYLVDTGTHVPLSLINSVSTKNSIVGDRIYLESVFPILVDGRIVIPPGSYVAGTITEIKRPGRVKGRGEFHLRFDSLTLPNGATRDFRAHLTGLDGRASEELDRKEGTIRSEGNVAGDVKTIGATAAAGASIGALAGSVAGSPGMGAAIGAGAGAAAALIGVMFTRGPDAVLAKGTTIEMILDRQVRFSEDELDFSNGMPRRSSASDSGGPAPSKKTSPVRRIPL
jgi:type IV secretion system protein VirB10